MKTDTAETRRYAVELVAGQVYSHAGGKPRLADVYLPQGAGEKLPTILWVHGGGWRFGDRRLSPDLSHYFAERGFAMVSFDYRLSDEVHFPAQVIDLKAAVRWVRSVAGQFSFDAGSIGLWGSSAGGHLSACAALSGDDEFMSDEHPGFSSAVQAVVDGYGPTDFSRMDADRGVSKPKKLDAESVMVKLEVPSGHPDSFESRLIGTAVSTSPREVQLANPVNYVRPGAPPFLILHGESDALVPWQQSWLLFEALRDAGNDTTLVLLENLGHGFFNNPKLDAVDVGLATIHSTTGKVSVTQGAACFSMVETFFRRHITLSQ